jgi:hypothetical protein
MKTLTSLLMMALLCASAWAQGKVAPLELDPANTYIVTAEGTQHEQVAAAVKLLQEWLRKATRSEKGFASTSAERLGDPAGKVVIALGETKWAPREEARRIWQDGYEIRRRDNVITIRGGKPRGTYNGVVGFLDKFCGVRFYLPHDLFTSLPKEGKIVLAGEIDVVEEPYVRATSMTGGGSTPGQGEWVRRNNGFSRTGLAGTHQHNMWGAFPPEKYAGKYPEIYPFIKGVRYIPKDAKDQAWNPCLTTPQLLDAAEESATAHYKANPDHLWYSFAFQDSHAVCECPGCLAAYAASPMTDKDPKVARAKAVSYLYWTFMNKLAGRLEEKLPGKKVEGLAYSVTRFAPPFKLHPNVVVFTNFHIAELEADGILKADAKGMTPVDEWLSVCSSYGNHDWYHGNGYLIPRIYSGYWSRYIRHLKSKVPFTYQHAELYWHWKLDGPKAWVLARMWWNPEADPKALLTQLCVDLFGPAAEPMAQYFTTLEELWTRLDNVEGPERKLFAWKTQFKTSDAARAEIARCRGLLDRAAGLAQTAQEKERVASFEKSFRVSEFLFALAAAEKVNRAKLEEFRAYVRDVIMPDPMTFKESGDEDIVKQVEQAIAALSAAKPVE